MLGNTLTLTIGGVATVMTKIDPGTPYTSEYMFRDSTHQYNARIRHSRTKASALRPSYDRHNFEIVETIFADGTDAEYQRKFYFVQEQLPQDTDVALADAVCDWAIASTNANLTSMLGWES
jgi:hypothetical protein